MDRVLLLMMATRNTKTLLQISGLYSHDTEQYLWHAPVPLLSKVPDVMTQNSAYGTSASADATDSNVPDVMARNSTYGTSASADATDSKVPDVMALNSAYGTSTSRDSKVPDVMTQNTAYGQLSTDNQGYENIATDFRIL